MQKKFLKNQKKIKNSNQPQFFLLPKEPSNLNGLKHIDLKKDQDQEL